MGASDADHAMTEAFHQLFQVERDEGLILDNERVGGDLGRELSTGLLYEPAQPGLVDAQNLRGFVLGEPLHGYQKKCLAGTRGDVAKPALDWQRGTDRLARAIDGQRVPDF